MDEKYPYQKEWEEYRKRRDKEFFVFISALPLMLLLSGIFEFLGVDSKDYFLIQLIVFVIWGVCYAVARANFHNWQCPQCYKRFFYSSFWITSPIFLADCRNCNLPKYYGSSFYKEF